MMPMTEQRTYQGRPLTKELIDELATDFERDWNESDVVVMPTIRGKALQALQSLDLPVEQIEALERRAKQEQKPFTSYLRSILQHELAV
jgi:hypothetical protein